MHVVHSVGFRILLVLGQHTLFELECMMTVQVHRYSHKLVLTGKLATLRERDRERERTIAKARRISSIMGHNGVYSWM